MKKEPYYAKLTIIGLSKMLRQKRTNIAFWLRSLASEVENNHEAYTDKVFNARLSLPIPRQRKRGVK